MGQPALADTGFPVHVGYAGGFAVGERFQKIEELFHLGFATDGSAAVFRLTQALLPAFQDVGGYGVQDALVVDLAFRQETELAVGGNLFVHQHGLPVRGRHDPGGQVDPVAHAGILRPLFPAYDAGKGGTHRHPHAEAEALHLAGGEGLQFALHHEGEFHGPRHVVFVGYRGTEKNDHQGTLVAVVHLFEIAPEVAHLIQDHGGEVVEVLVGTDRVEGEEARHYRAEFAGLVVAHHFGRQEGRGDLGVDGG